MISLFLNKNICCYPSLELVGEMVLMRGHNICFYGEIWSVLPKLSMLPFLIWSTEALVKIPFSYNI